LEPEYRKVRFGRSKRRRNLLREGTWKIAMLKNYLTTTLRNLQRHKGFAAINLGGLAIGLAACLLIGLFVQDELAYDHFHEKGDRLYRLGSSTVGWPYGRILEAEYPEVEDVVYLRTYPTYSIEHDGQHLFETSDTDGEVYVAVDQGVIVKIGLNVLVSVRRAVLGTDLGQLRRSVEHEFLTLDETETTMRSAMAKLESGFIRRFASFQHE
jgi:hypothetical protein